MTSPSTRRMFMKPRTPSPVAGRSRVGAPRRRTDCPASMPAASASTRSVPSKSHVGDTTRCRSVHHRGHPLSADQSFTEQVGSHRADETNSISVDVRFDFGSEIVFVLDNSGNDQPPARHPRNLDGMRRSLVRMNTTEEEQVVTGDPVQFESLDIDSMVDRRRVGQPGMPIRVTY